MASAKHDLVIARRESALAHRVKEWAMKKEAAAKELAIKSKASRAIESAKFGAVVNGGGRFVGLLGGALIHRDKSDWESWLGPVAFATSVACYGGAMFAKDKDIPLLLGGAGVADGLSARYLIQQFDTALVKKK